MGVKVAKVAAVLEVTLVTAAMEAFAVLRPKMALVVVALVVAIALVEVALGY
jgi:hypothetical protein